VFLFWEDVAGGLHNIECADDIGGSVRYTPAELAMVPYVCANSTVNVTWNTTAAPPFGVNVVKLRLMVFMAAVPGGDIVDVFRLGLTGGNCDAQVATFTVTKDFVPDNSMEVEVFIDCNDGLPLTSDQLITEDSPGVTFIVELFTPGNLDCEITEVPVPGGYDDSYAASSTDGVAGAISNIDGCQFEEVEGGNFACEITNTAQDATYQVNKVWDVIGEGGDRISQEFDLSISCTEAIKSASPNPDFGPATDEDRYLVRWLGLVGDRTVQVTVDSSNGTASCRARESVFTDAVEIDNPCRNDRLLTIGQTTRCTITNTVFFEGIPTLSRYSLALLALLMLGVGMIGFRRLV